MTWARNTRTGEEATGRSDHWYGSDGDWPASEVEEFEQQIGGVGTFGKCQKCVDRYHEARERAAEYNSPAPPEWFDESYAGERWDNDY